MAKKKAPAKAKEPAKPKDPSAKKGFKLDTTRVKEFLIAKGERVGLVVAASLMLLLLLSGISMGLGTRSQYPEVKKNATALMQSVNKDGPPDKIAPMQIPPWSWALASLFPSGGWYDPGAIVDDKVFNPYVMSVVTSLDTIKGTESTVRMDVVRGPVEYHKFEPTTKELKVFKSGTGPAKATSSSVQPVNYIKPKRMMVVSTLFPYQRQLEMYQKALRKATVQDVLNDDKSAPKFVGLNVIRYEIKDGKVVEGSWKKLFFKDPDPESKAPVEIDDEWIKFMAEAKFDKNAYEKVSKQVVRGLVTPLPQLADGSYPDPELPGIKVEKKDKKDKATKDDKGKKDVKPMLPGTDVTGGKKPDKAAAGEIVSMPLFSSKDDTGASKKDGLVDLDKFLADKVQEIFNPFDPYGEKTTAKKKKTPTPPTGGVPPDVGSIGKPPDKGKMPMDNPDGEEDKKPPAPPVKPSGPLPSEYLLVRFLDVNVEPGKTYQYLVQVRLANPNYKNTEKVAIPDLAKVKELLSEWTPTDIRTVNEDFRFYLVDQFYLDPPKTNHPGTKDVAKEKARNEDSFKYAIVQVHYWVEKAVGSKSDVTYKPGIWAVAERVLVQKGQYVGKSKMEVPLPEWHDSTGKFEPPGPTNKKKDFDFDKGTAYIKDFTYLTVEMPDPAQTPLVIDFNGGYNEQWRLPDNDTVKDRTQVQMLVFSPDGKLLAYSSRDDSDPDSERSLRGSERLAQYAQWQNLVAPPGQQPTARPNSRPFRPGYGGYGYGKGGYGSKWRR
jgi:hypothetical protein